MITILLCMIIGFLIDAFPKFPERLHRLCEWLMSGFIWVLILSMGISFGIKLDIKTFRSIGLQSILFTIFTGLFSILFVYFLSRGKRMEEEEK